MLNRRVVFSLVVLGLFCYSAPAAQFQELTSSYSIQDIIDDLGGELRVDDKVFSDWIVDTAKSVGAFAPLADGITVVGGRWVGGMADGEIGLKFTSHWAATTNQIAASTIVFKVTADSPWLISDNTLYMEAFGADNGGSAVVSENVYHVEPGPGVDSFADKSVYFYSINNNKKQTAHLDYDPADYDDEIWVAVAAGADGGLDPAGSANVDQFFVTFSQVPEPATMALLALGAAALIRRRQS